MSAEDRAALRRCELDQAITVTYATDERGRMVTSLKFKPNTGLPVLDGIYGDLFGDL